MDVDFEKQGGLVPAIVQDAATAQVLMLGYMNREALEQTLATGRVTFWSRSRQRLWTKGEESGHYLLLDSVKADCDADALLVRARPLGPTCHAGTQTCWGEGRYPPAALGFLSELQDVVEERRRLMSMGEQSSSYTASLFRDGVNRIAQKVGEEAIETVLEAVGGTNERLVYEASDLMYHLIVLLASKGLRIEQVAEELAVRHKPGWKKH